MTEIQELNFKQMVHFAFTNEYVNQEKDEATNIWRITRTRRSRGGYTLGKSKVEYFIGKETKKYKTEKEVLDAYNNQNK